VTAAYEELRPLLFSIAYRMLGSVSEAEDVVQETFLRFHRAVDEVESPKAYLSTVATRLAIDHLRSARVRREQYVGPWLPEPLLTAEAEDDEDDETLSLAFLVVLETLSPVERAVFLLRDVFDFGYDEIAAIVERSEDNCRQLAVRARRRVEERRPRFETSREQRDELARRFFEAADAGDTDGLVSLLADDVVLYGDGGGKAPAAPYPIQGRERLSRVLVGFAKQNRRFGLRVRPAQVNGQPGAAMVDADGAIVYVVGLDVADGLVQAVRSIVNPDKLRHLRT
jgi:RNA polymerase sigma-70 factor, ECF subfamily